jgi:nitroreductase
MANGRLGRGPGCRTSGGAAAASGRQGESGEVKVETWDAIRSRRNVRSYAEQAIAPQDLDQILEAARRSPSAGNQQAWDFVVCTDPEQLTQLAKVWQAARHVASSAATIALVAPRSDDAQMRDLIQFDLGQATMSIMLAAADLGIGSAHAGVHDQELARRVLGFPEDRFCALLISLGVPADRPLRPIERPNRRPFEDVVHRGQW